MAPALGMSVTLNPSITSPAPLGTVVTWQAGVSGDDAGNLWYRFRVRPAGGDFRVIKDYGPGNSLDWTESEREATYEIEASARNRDTGDMAVATASFEMQSRVNGNQPAINPTSHPMVFLYSAPPCSAGARVRVHFRNAEGIRQSTPFRPCRAGSSSNFYIAGLRGDSQYTVNHTVVTDTGAQEGPMLTLTTPAPPVSLATATAVNGPATPVRDGILLQATLFTNTMATDLYGNLIWYYPGNISMLTRPAEGGHFFGIIEDTTADPSGQIVREFDLTGMTVRETNAARVGEQLVAMGMQPITSFHHEARRLPDGRILVLGGEERILSDVQGDGPVDVLGDVIVVMDSNLQVVWAWDAFDHLDVTRRATLNDQCQPGNCPPTYLAPVPNDWLHGNSVQQTPDGNLLYSARNQDWVIKIDYANGTGSGDVLWRLGPGGDFQIQSADPLPWFTHQHDPQLLADNTLTLFDNGNVRNATDPAATSRGQVLLLNEQDRVATLLLNVDMGLYSFALGAAQRLPNGDYHFDVGFLSDGTSISTEVDASGQSVYTLHASAPEYRSFRMRDLYSPPQP